MMTSIERIEIVSDDLDLDKFLADWKVQDIVIRNLEIVGEASRHIDNDLKKTYPEVSWNEANALRNVLIHEYFGISIKQVWLTIKNDLPTLKAQIKKIIADLNQNPI